MQNDAARLQGSFRRLAIGVGLVVLSILAFLIWREYRLQIQRELELHYTALGEKITAVDAIVTAADAHLSALRMSAERRLSQGGYPPVPVLESHVGYGDTVELIQSPPKIESVVIARPARLRVRATASAELAFIQDLAANASIVHKVQPYFRWSYFFSAARDLIAVAPFAPIETFMGTEDQTAVMESYYDYDVYRLTTLASNPQRTAVWTPVYIDAGGAGLMVSHTAPVDIDGTQRGIVGTDVLLATLSDRLALSEDDPSLILLVDQSGNLVADSRHLAAGAPNTLAASAHSPVPLAEAGAGKFASVDGHYVLALPIPGTPWTIYNILPATEVRTDAIEGVTPFLAFLVLLAATMLGGYLMIRRGYLQPAFALADTLERRGAGEQVEEPKVGRAWRPWFERVRDIFDSRDRMVARLAEAEAKSAAIISVALDAVVTTDNAGRVVDFNPAAERMFGRRADEAIGVPIGDLIVPEHLRAAHSHGMERHARTGKSHVLGQRIELDALHSTGKVFPVEIQIHMLQKISQVRYAAYIRDLTEQREAARALRSQQEKLYQAEKLTAMGSLLAGLAHELNNPLAVVIAQTSLLEEITAEGPARSRATKIRVAAERCGRIVRTFLSMARKEMPQRTRVDLRELVRHSLEVLAYGLRSGGVDVVEHHAADLPLVEADADQLNQVVINLIVNAQQAFGDLTGERRVFIDTEVGDGEVILKIADNGPGIPDAVIDRIFEAFFTTKPVGVGTGIGLAVSSSIIEAHGGRITAGNRPEGGAEFTIRLPAEGVRPAAIIAPEAEAPAASAPALAARQLLVVDDEPEVADSLVGYLELEGHQMTTAHSIPEALAALDGGAFHAVFCDLRMPGGGGTAFWAEVAKRDPALADRFVFVTGDMVAGPEMLRGASAGRPIRILEKPFMREDVRTALLRLFEPETDGAP